MRDVSGIGFLIIFGLIGWFIYSVFTSPESEQTKINRTYLETKALVRICKDGTNIFKWNSPDPNKNLVAEGAWTPPRRIDPSVKIEDVCQ